MNGNDTVTIKSGEVVGFPVASDHPFAKYQKLKAVSELGNLHDLAVVSKMTRAAPVLSTVDITKAVNGILSSAGVSTIVDLTMPDFVVQAGATLILRGPITQLTVGNFVLDGTVIAYGSFNLTCISLGAGSVGPTPGQGEGGGLPPGYGYPQPPQRPGPIRFE